MNFVKRVFNGDVDEHSHRQFVRFGKGDYKGRFLLSLWKTKNIKVKSSFEFANDFVLFAADLGVTFSGVILSKDPVQEFDGKKKAGIWAYEVKDLSGDKVKELYGKVYYLLLDADGDNVKLRIKKKLPKPGKDEGKIDDKFCQLEIDAKHYSNIKGDFFWDMPDGKKISIKHEVLIDRIIMPEGEKDFAKIREMAKRAGKIIRTAECDGKVIVKETNFEA